MENDRWLDEWAKLKEHLTLSEVQTLRQLKLDRDWQRSRVYSWDLQWNRYALHRLSALETLYGGNAPKLRAGLRLAFERLSEALLNREGNPTTEQRLEGRLLWWLWNRGLDFSEANNLHKPPKEWNHTKDTT